MVTGALLEKLEIVTKNLIEIAKNHDLTDNLKRFDFKGYGFRWKGSSHGKWVHFCKLEEFGSKILPTKTSNVNSSFYYHNDFNYYLHTLQQMKVNYMTRSEVLTLCEILPEFIQNMISKIQSLTDKEQNFLNKFANIE